MLVDARLSGRKRGGQGPFDLIDDLVRLLALLRAAPFPIVGHGAHRTGGQERGLKILRKSRQRLPCISFTRKAGAAQFLPGFAVLVTLLAELLVDGALGLRLAGLGVDQEPALLNAAVG